MFMMVLPLIARQRLIDKASNNEMLKGGRELKYPAIPVARSKPV
jgi:hypothetical protein